jgi:hypothetical protein
LNWDAELALDWAIECLSADLDTNCLSGKLIRPLLDDFKSLDEELLNLCLEGVGKYKVEMSYYAFSALCKAQICLGKGLTAASAKYSGYCSRVISEYRSDVMHGYSRIWKKQSKAILRLCGELC